MRFLSSLSLPSLILLLRVKHQRMEPHAVLKTRTETSPRRGLEREFSRNLGFAPYPGPQRGRPASDQHGIVPARGNNVSPGAFPVRVPADTPGPGRAVPAGPGPVLGQALGLHGPRPCPRDAQEAPSPPCPCACPPPSGSITPVSRGGLWAAPSWGSQLERAGREGAQGEDRRCRQTEAVLQAPGAGR